MDGFSEHLVAHRGDRAGGVENTLAGFVAAYRAGARLAECDIQFSRDLVPLVIHDNYLQRLCGRPVRVSELTADEVRDLCRPYFVLSDLHELLDWLQQAHDLSLFIEIKPPVRRRLTDRGIVRRIGAMLPRNLLPRLAVIGMSARLMDACAAGLDCAVGWVAEGPRAPVHPMQYVFLPWRRAGETGEWQAMGSRVALYTVNDAAHAAALLGVGADLIETNHYARMADELG